MHLDIVGKTESTKLVLRYLAAISSKVAERISDDNSASSDFEGAIFAANPITESFGNAKTSRNNNSSRFGKYIELYYSSDGYIEGASICTYLLETVRLTTQMSGERNYHVFYEVAAGLSSDMKESWGLLGLDQYGYTNQSGHFTREDGESDEGNYRRLRDAMKQIGLEDHEQLDVLRAVVGILNMGNVSFVESGGDSGSEAAAISDDSRRHVACVSELLGIDEASLRKALTERTLVVVGTEIKRSLGVDGARAARDTFAQILYNLLFKWMIRSINDTLVMDQFEPPASSIGILDIFGFEHFERNSFEQFCINYANEKLQDHFNFAIFQSEEEVYLQEGLTWSFVDYPDNSQRLELFELKSSGLFALCDEQLKIPKPSDEKLVKSMYDKCLSKTHFSAGKAEKARLQFVIHHFACDVKYNVHGFVDKNRGEIYHEFLECINGSYSWLLQELFDVAEEGAETHNKESFVLTRSSSSSSKRLGMLMSSRKSSRRLKKSTVGKRTSTVSSQFSLQLKDLVAKIRTNRSHFIRCIKPNKSFQSGAFDYEMVMSQLRCGGALGAVQVFRAGFPNRMEFSYFVRRYSALLCVCGRNPLTRDAFECTAAAIKSGSDKYWQLAALALIAIVPLTEVMLSMIVDRPLSDVNVLEGLQMGRTKIFLRAPVFEQLESIHYCAMDMLSRSMQRRHRAKALSRNSTAHKRCLYPAVQALMYFADYRKRRARTIVSSTLLLQRRARVLLAVRCRKRVVRGCTLVKARWRGYKARVYVAAMKSNAALLIQTAYRRSTTRRRYIGQRTSAILLQRIVRGYQARVQRLVCYRSILLMQRCIRGYLGRLAHFTLREAQVRLLVAICMLLS